MRTYTYSEARRKLASLLDRATEEGEVRIKRRDGQTFVIKPDEGKGSPLDVEGIDLGVTTEEIVKIVQEGRRRDYE
jgi:PHD/YefM family antitoxin component YafN of YafNO toxin-antitoxin module